jgi:glycosyltransferase involved in cell wall biosynthesis
MRRVFFYRDLAGLTGGHLKVWDYFCHVNSSADFRGVVYLTPRSLCGAANPWRDEADQLPTWHPEKADAIFLGGLDWKVLPETLAASIPIINLVQHVRHADPADERYAFLERAAIRVCVSPEVTEALRATRRVRGPLITIPNGVSLPSAAGTGRSHNAPLLIEGIKNPAWAREIAAELARRGLPARTLTVRMARPEYLETLADAGLAVFLPHQTEGFYLPALEAMALGTLVVCPDVLGNRSFCMDGINCYRPSYTKHDIIDAAVRALSMGEAQRRRMVREAHDTSRAHTLAAERATFHARVLAPLDELWRGATDPGRA